MTPISYSVAFACVPHMEDAYASVHYLPVGTAYEPLTPDNKVECLYEKLPNKSKTLTRQFQKP